MLILLGSTRPAKVDGAREALRAIASIDSRFGEAEVRSVDLTDVAPRMPMTEAEILAGAEARARALLARFDGGGASRLAVGLEGGLDPVVVEGRTRYALKTWAAVTDGTTWGYGAGGTIVIPDRVAGAVLAGAELGDVIDGLGGAGTRSVRGAWGVLTRDLISRRDAFRIAVLSACAPFFHPEVFR